MDDAELLSKIKPFIKKTEDMIQKSKQDNKKKGIKLSKRVKPTIPDKKCQLCEKIISHQEYFKLITNKDYCLCLTCKKQIEAKSQQFNEFQNFIKNFKNKFVIDETYPFTSFLVKEKDGFITKINKYDKSNSKYKLTFNVLKPQYPDQLNEEEEKEEDKLINKIDEIKLIFNLNDNNTVLDLFFELIIKLNINIDCYLIEYKFIIK